MVVKGLLERDTAGALTLTDRGRAVLRACWRTYDADRLSGDQMPHDDATLCDYVIHTRGRSHHPGRTEAPVPQLLLGPGPLSARKND
jgi:hypothetical protein